MVMLVFWGASSPHFSDQKVVQHQTAIYQRAIFFWIQPFFCGSFLKFWNPPQTKIWWNFPWILCWIGFVFILQNTERPSGDPVGKLPPVVQYSEPKPAIPWLRLALPSSTSAIEKTNPRPWVWFKLTGGIFPMFFCWEISSGQTTGLV